MTQVAAVGAKAGPVGVSGWLYVPILGFVGTILLTGFNLLAILKEADGLKKILVATEGPLVQLKAPLVADVTFALAGIASAAYCLYLIATKRRRILNMATVHYLILPCGALADVWVGGAVRAVLPSTRSILVFSTQRRARLPLRRSGSRIFAYQGG